MALGRSEEPCAVDEGLRYGPGPSLGWKPPGQSSPPGGGPGRVGCFRRATLLGGRVRVSGGGRGGRNNGGRGGRGGQGGRGGRHQQGGRGGRGGQHNHQNNHQQHQRNQNPPHNIDDSSATMHTQQGPCALRAAATSLRSRAAATVPPRACATSSWLQSVILRFSFSQKLLAYFRRTSYLVPNSSRVPRQYIRSSCTLACCAYTGQAIKSPCAEFAPAGHVQAREIPLRIGRTIDLRLRFGCCCDVCLGDGDVVCVLHEDTFCCP